MGRCTPHPLLQNPASIHSQAHVLDTHSCKHPVRDYAARTAPGHPTPDPPAHSEAHLAEACWIPSCLATPLPCTSVTSPRANAGCEAGCRKG